jgi:hypothetical protein
MFLNSVIRLENRNKKQGTRSGLIPLQILHSNLIFINPSNTKVGSSLGALYKATKAPFTKIEPYVCTRIPFIPSPRISHNPTSKSHSRSKSKVHTRRNGKPKEEGIELKYIYDFCTM